MKKLVLSLFISLISGMMMVSAQNPTTTWPYIFQDFSQTQVYLKSGGKLNYLANVHLQGSKLHYVKDGSVIEASMSDILLVEINSRRFMNINNSLMEIITEGERGFVAKKVEPDFSKLNETGGAYGASSNTTSTRALTSLEGVGSVTSHMMQRSDKESGKVIPLKHEYYIVANGGVYPGQKKLFEKLLPLDKQSEYKLFIKSNKIKWHNPDDLLKLVEILN